MKIRVKIHISLQSNEDIYADRDAYSARQKLQLKLFDLEDVHFQIVSTNWPCGVPWLS